MARFPELKGRLYSAPEHNALLAREAAQAVASRACTNEPRPRPIAAADTLRIEVIGEPEFSRAVTVQRDGAFDFPYVGLVLAKGLTPDELRQFLSDRLKRYLRDPQVKVFLGARPIGRFTSDPQRIEVLGVVTSPGRRDLEACETLAGVLTLAGGFSFTDKAELRQVLVLRPRRGDRRAFPVVADFQALLVYGDMAQDVPLEPGDIVFVPARQTGPADLAPCWRDVMQYLVGALPLEGLLWRLDPPSFAVHLPPPPRRLW